MGKGLDAEIKRTRRVEVLEEEVHLAIPRTAAVPSTRPARRSPFGITQTHNVLRFCAPALAGCAGTRLRHA
jgi:hypothetical protein